MSHTVIAQSKPVKNTTAHNNSMHIDVAHGAIASAIDANAAKSSVSVCCKKVMIVEDDRELREMLKMSLDLKLKVRVVAATDGFMALMMARGEYPDLILMDLNMPYVDGFQSIALLKADVRTRDIPIMALSNYCWDFDWKRKALDLGCLRCIDKTRDVLQLTCIVKEFLTGCAEDDCPTCEAESV